MNTKEIETYGLLLADCFMDDPGVTMQFAGIRDKAGLFRKQCQCQLSAFDRLGGVTLLEDGQGIAMGYFTGEEEKMFQYASEEAASLLAYASQEDLMAIQEKAKIAMETVKQDDQDWFRKFVGDREVYVIQAIAIHPDSRGTGAFRRLMTKTMERAEKRGLPVAVQTFREENVAKYVRMGFRMMETVTSSQVKLVCYNLLKIAEPLEGDEG